MKKIFLLIISSFFALSGWSQLLSEHFAYTPDAALGLSVQSGGAWSIINTGDSILVDAGSLTYSGLAASTGNKVKFDGSGTDYYTSFTGQTTGSTYASFILNVSSLGTLGTTGGYFGGFIQTGSTSLFAAAVWTRQSTTAGKYNIGISTRSNSAVTWLAGDYTPGTPNLIVIAYDIVTGTANDVARIWVNPTSLGGAEPTADATAVAGTDITGPGRFFLRQDNATNTPFIEFDELRVATDYATVTPTGAATPTLSSTALTAFGNICLNTTSTPNSFTITGSNLTAGNVTVAALSGYAYSTTAGGTYTATLTIPETGTLSQQVFVELTPTAVQSYSGNIGVTGGGAPAINVAASGAGINTIPTVTTAAATGITTSTATVPGTITANGCSTVTAYGIEYSTTAGFANGTGTAVPSTNQVAGAYTSALSGLTPGTIYYYHAYATNGGGTGYSSEMNFTTTALSPTLSATTLTAFGNVCLNTTAGPNSFTISGSSLTAGNITVAALAGYTYSTTAGGTYTPTLTIAETGTLSQQVFVNFTPAAVQSYNGNIGVSGGGATAINVAASGAGINTLATVTSGAASAVTTTSATVAGNISANGCSAVTAYGIEYSTTPGFANGTGTAVPSTNQVAGAYTSALSGLAQSTIYYYHAYATNGGGTAYGAELNFTTNTASTVTSGLVISQLYGSGGNAGATYTADYVELKNITTSPINTAGLSIQYGSAGVTGAWSGVYALPAASIPAGAYYLIQMSAVGAVGIALPTPDATASPAINMSGTAGRVALVNGTTALSGCPTAGSYIDFVGFGTTATCFEGTGPAAAPGAALADFRKLNGCQDTNDNAADFDALTPSARNSASAAISCVASASLSATALITFGNVCLNTTSTPNSFTITGSNLTAGNITVAALSGYTYSTTAGGTYTATLTIPETGTLSQQVFVEFTPTAVQSYNGNIAISGGGATAINVAASGAGVNTVPTVTTAAATGITTSTATVPGTITANGCTAVTAYGIEYSTTSGFVNGTGTAVPSTNIVAGSFTSSLTGLASGTVYYYHAYATNGGGTGYSSELNFTTTALSPTLSATALTAFGNVCLNTTAGPNSFTITGSALTAGNITVAALPGYTYSTTAGGTYTATLTLAETGGTYTQQVFVKFTPTAVQSYSGNIGVSGGGATAINVAASGAGINTLATVTAGAASAITSSSATVAGTITANGCSAITAYGIEYSTTPGFANGTGTAAPSTNQVAGAYTSALSGLAAATTYYYHAYATNGGGTAYSSQANFTTTGAASLSATALTAFGTVCTNTTAGPNSFTITGTGLVAGNITVAALAGYTYSTTSGGTYTATLTIAETGTLSQQVFVKFTPTAVQSYNGNIGVSGGGATAINVAASGAGVNTLATVVSGAASAITTSSATVAGTFTANGCSAVTAYGIEYSTTPGFANGTGTAVASTNQVAGAYTSALSGLTAATNYYYHAYATNGGGTAYGTEMNFTTNTASTTTSGLVISQLYGSGGNAGAVYTADYVELKNITTSPISTSGLSIQYGSAAVTGAWSGVYALPAATIPPGAYYLIQMSAAGTTGVAIPTPDATATPAINMSGTAGRLALVNGTTALTGCPTAGSYIDFVGYGTTATCFEGATGPAAAPSATLADFRKLNGCQDTNDNTADFDALAAAPRNSATAPISCGTGTSPTLSATALTAFGATCLNTTAGPNSFTITGSNLTAGTVTVGALSGYTYSTTSGGTYTATLALPSTAGAFSQQVFVKFTPAAVQSYNGNIAISGGGVTTPINVAASGSGVNTIATVVSGAASAITANSATVAGTITANGCSAITAYGVEYSITNGFANGTGTAVPSTNQVAGAYTSALSGLASSTVYYYHAYATNSGGTAYGAQGTFTTTAPTTPTLSSTAPAAFGNVCVNTTAGPNNFTISGALLTNANITVGPLAGFTFATTSGGTYTASLTLTQPGGTYSQQVFVKFTPTAIQSYSGNIPVSGGGATTINVAASGAGVNSAPTATAGAASGITGTSATVAGTISATGCTAVTAYGIEYSTTAGFANGTGTAVASTNLSGINFTSALTGLIPATVYYYHAYATNGGGTGYSIQQSFTTAAAVITPGTLAAFGNACLNSAAGPNSFTLTSTGVNASNINIAALAGYTYSATATGTYTTTLSLTHPAGAYSQTVYVKFTPTAAQAYNGNIVISGGGISGAVNVAASGTGFSTPVVVVTGAATNITMHSVTLGGTVTASNCNTSNTAGVEYSSIGGFVSGTGIKVPASVNSGSYTVDISGLVQNTFYYYKAYSISTAGTVYGAVDTFKTAGVPAGLVIYSNPIFRGGQLNFTVDNAPPAHYVASIINNLGQVVFSQGIISQLNFLDTHITVPSFLPVGTYVLMLRNTNGTLTASKRFMIL